MNQVVFQGIQNLIVVFAVVLVLAVLFSIFMSQQIIKPLQRMIAGMRLTGEGHLDPMSIPKHMRKTEIGALMEYYNTMVRRINQGIDTTLLYELNNKRMELKMLQYQINPHFLYNTLNTISALAEIENVPQIMEITDNLSQLLRYNVMENSVVPVADEIHFARNYLQIQNVRFPGRFQTEIRIPPRWRNATCSSSCCSRWWKTVFPTACAISAPAPRCALLAGGRGRAVPLRL